jgi:phospholipid/cholesterol/gamma-HCH transport system permease protein
MKSFFDFFGGKTLRLNADLGAMGIFFFRSFIMIFRIKQIQEIIAQVYFIGAKSAQIVLLVGFFTGMVLGLQLYFVLPTPGR